MNSVEIGKRIKQVRESKNLSQDDLAKRLGLNKSSIQRYESGQVQRIKLPVIENMAAFLGVNPSWLILKTDDPTPTINNFTLSDNENKLLFIYRNLNAPGKSQLMLQADILSRTDEYKKGADPQQDVG